MQVFGVFPPRHWIPRPRALQEWDDLVRGLVSGPGITILDYRDMMNTEARRLYNLSYRFPPPLVKGPDHFSLTRCKLGPNAPLEATWNPGTGD